MTVTMVIIDDDSGFRRVAADFFASYGVNVLAQAVDGSSGIAATLQHRPDWVLLDVNLPDQDGLTVARTLRDLSIRSSILLTSSGQSMWSEEELSIAGVRMYVDKQRLFCTEVLDLVVRGEGS